MKQRLKSQKGLTLVELMISMAVSMILLGACAGLLVYGFNLYNKANDYNQAHVLGLLTQQKIESEVKYAASMKIDASQPGSLANGNYCLALTGSGRLAKYTGTASAMTSNYVYLDGVYRGYVCSITFKASTGSTLNVEVTVSKGGETITDTTTDIILNNMGKNIPSGQDINATVTQGNAIEFTLPSA
ncbi:MAG TPA: prepilin-type N-terminal cleavage/methylation domain-containing protein [Clostridia bacterium]|nr:prepilin-type N-terminal cleavage/methylation domain-containing protein [Clostridia bacterium]